YWPANRSLTRWLVRIWILRTALSCSRVSMRRVRAAPARGAARERPSGHRYAVEHAAYDLVGVDLLRLRLVGDDHAMAQHVGPDRLHVLGGHVAAALQEGVRLRRQGEVEGGAG